MYILRLEKNLKLSSLFTSQANSTSLHKDITISKLKKPKAPNMNVSLKTVLEQFKY